MVRLDLLNVGLVEETGGILLVMRAPEVAQLLVIETGALEGQAIVMEAGGIRAERPLTQDLLYDAIEQLGATVRAVYIEDFHDETFFARVVLAKTDGGGRDIELDARPSDAVALALRAQAPIFANEEVMEEFGVPEERTGRYAALFNEDEEPPGGHIVH